MSLVERSIGDFLPLNMEIVLCSNCDGEVRHAKQHFYEAFDIGDWTCEKKESENG